MVASCTVCSEPTGCVTSLVGQDGRNYNELKCPICGLAWTDPMPEFSELSDDVYDEDFYEPSMTSLTRSASEARVVNAMADFVERTILPGRFLDVGCGEGLHMALMRERGWEVSGVEVSRFAVEHARQAHGLEVFHGGLLDAPFEPESFDLIQMRHVIEHLTDPKAVLEGVSRLLKPGGMLRIDTPSGEFWGSGLGFVFRMIGNGGRCDAAQVHLDPPMHVYCFTGTALCKLVVQCGLSVTKLIRTYHGNPEHYPQPPAFSLFGRVARGLDLASSKFNLGELLVLYATKNGERRS